MSWGSLRAVSEEAKEIAREEREKVLVDCPNCGEPLIEARGRLHCRFDGFNVLAGTKAL